MNQHWTPESRVRITDEGMVIEIKLDGALPTSATFENGTLLIRGQHEDLGKFECRFEIPANHNPVETKITLEDGIFLRIKVPAGKKKKEVMLGPIPILINVSGVLPKPGKTAAAVFSSKPHPMMIYCNGCGKHFDIVAGKGAREYRCPHCGKVQTFSLETLISQALEQGEKMLRRKRSSR
jgi:predicted RNA-binding Zn-ribbon protein involved in translation (DUF1610 family)